MWQNRKCFDCTGLEEINMEKKQLDWSNLGFGYIQTDARFVSVYIVMPIPDVETTWADELSDSDRGEGGYGSTGR